MSQVFELKVEERTRCEVWTRVMGYHRPVSAFNAGKRSEHRERTYFASPPWADRARPGTLRCCLRAGSGRWGSSGRGAHAADHH